MGQIHDDVVNDDDLVVQGVVLVVADDIDALDVAVDVAERLGDLAEGAGRIGYAHAH